MFYPVLHIESKTLTFGGSSSLGERKKFQSLNHSLKIKSHMKWMFETLPFAETIMQRLTR